MVKSIYKIGILLAAFCASGEIAMAQLASEPDAPIDITGKNFEVQDGKNMAIWTGDVQVVQAEIVLTAPRLVIKGIDDGEIDEMIATGGIRYTNGAEAISGQKAVYKAATKTITVTGNVVIVQDQQVMTGDKLVYFTETGEVQISSVENKRVRGIFYTGGTKKSES
ncbi:MAG: lipopolysaccharide transport periplasmic protein LptA [bacterium]